MRKSLLRLERFARPLAQGFATNAGNPAVPYLIVAQASRLHQKKVKPQGPSSAADFYSGNLKPAAGTAGGILRAANFRKYNFLTPQMGRTPYFQQGQLSLNNKNIISIKLKV